MTLLKKYQSNHGPTEIKSLSVNSHNRVLIELLRPVVRSNRPLFAVGILLAIVTGGLAQVQPLINKWLTDSIIEIVSRDAEQASGYQLLMQVLWLLVLAGVMSTAAEFGLRQVGERLKVDAERHLSNLGAKHLIGLDVASAGPTSEERARQVQRVERGAEGVAKIAKTLCADLSPMIVGALMSIWVMLAVNPRIGLIAVATVPVYIALAVQQGSRQAGVRTAIRDAREHKFSAFHSVVALLEIVQSYVRQEYETKRHGERSLHLAGQENRHHLVNHVCDSLKLGVDQFGGTVVLIATSFLVLQDQLPVGAIVLNLGLYRNVSAPIRELHRVYTEYQEALVLSGGLFEVLSTKSSIVSPSDAVHIDEKSTGGRRIRLEGVSFGYQEERVLHDVDIELRRGETTALVGASGTGKSTIASLISRFYDPDLGRVTMDGIDLRNLDVDWLRGEVGFVGQQNHVTSGTVLENLLYGSPRASQQEIAESLRRAGLQDFMEERRGLLNIPVERLSGGQKQRVALARVFLKNPSVLVLDEPTASLDAANVELISQAIEDLRRDRTVLVIAHDPAMFIGAQSIYVLDNGRVVEHGTHEELQRAKGEYARIIRANIVSRRLRDLLDGHANAEEQVA